MDSSLPTVAEGSSNQTLYLEAEADHEMCPTLEQWLNVSAISNASRENFVNFSSGTSPLFATPVYGYVTPFLLMITFFTNSVVVAVLSRPHMKSPSNFILCAMAISDLCTLGIPVPMFIYQYTLGLHPQPVPCYLAVLDLLMTDILPTVFHSASIWLTLMLAVQRYIYVCHPGKARIWCTIPRVTYGTLVIYTVAVVYNLPRLFQQTFSTVVIPWECRPVEQCISDWTDWSTAFMPVFFWFRFVCVMLLPCLSLVVLNSLLVASLNEAQANRKRLFRESKPTASSKQRDSNCTTMMLVAVVCVFLIVELPLAILTLIVIVQNTWEQRIIDPGVINILITFSNLCIVLSYSIYFPIYCSMSRQFRETFKELFTRAKQFTQDTARNGIRGGSQRRRTTQRNRQNGRSPPDTNGETVYISTADMDETTYNKSHAAATMQASASGGPNGDEERTKESETLL